MEQKIEFLTNNKFVVNFPSEFAEFNITPWSVMSVENVDKNMLQINIKIITADSDFKQIPNQKDICGLEMSLLKQKFDEIEISILNNKGDKILLETYHYVQLVEVKRSSIFNYDNDKPITFGLKFVYESVDYDSTINNNIICE